MSSLAIYIHWPFCKSKCPYCDFNSRPISSSLDQELWAKAYIQDLIYYSKFLPNREISSIYFGGGTPSLMEEKTIEKILNVITKNWKISNNVEITLEANPSSVLSEKMHSFKSLGVNRISMGVQSFDDDNLRFLGRVHTSKDAKKAIETISNIYDRYSFDLIYSLAGQTLKSWEKELMTALSFSPKHLSIYQLTIEENTPFFKRSKKEKLNADDILCIEMYEIAQSILNERKLYTYEISNHAIEGEESLHNLSYWNYDDYIGIGAGAHGRFIEKDNIRFATEAEKNPSKWLSELSPRCKKEIITKNIAMQEALMMGLRTKKGIDKRKWKEKFEINLTDFIESVKMEELEKEGFVFDSKDNFIVTSIGLQRLNAVLNYLL